MDPLWDPKSAARFVRLDHKRGANVGGGRLPGFFVGPPVLSRPDKT
jgi:hypothetical protein